MQVPSFRHRSLQLRLPLMSLSITLSLIRVAPACRLQPSIFTFVIILLSFFLASFFIFPPFPPVPFSFYLFTSAFLSDQFASLPALFLLSCPRPFLLAKSLCVSFFLSVYLYRLCLYCLSSSSSFFSLALFLFFSFFPERRHFVHQSSYLTS